MIAREDEIAEPQTVEEMAEALDQIVDITNEGVDELKALSAPEGDEETASAYGLTGCFTDTGG
jgi:hypothetical protein